MQNIEEQAGVRAARFSTKPIRKYIADYIDHIPYACFGRPLPGALHHCFINFERCERPGDPLSYRNRECAIATAQLCNVPETCIHSKSVENQVHVEQRLPIRFFRYRAFSELHYGTNERAALRFTFRN